MATILTRSDEEAVELARTLLAAADDPADVVTTSEGSRIAFDVPDALARKLAKPKREPKKEAAEDSATD